MKDLEKTLEDGWSQLQKAIDKVYNEMNDTVRFEYSIFYQPGDGFVVEHETKNAPFSKCLQIIKKKGELTLEDYLRICI